MPIYEYACEKCENEFEVEQRITEDPIKTCPSCKARKARRLISRTSFVLKGGGWYSDLYASPGAKKDEGKKSDDKGEKKSSDDKGDKKSSESKKSKDGSSKSKSSKGKSRSAA